MNKIIIVAALIAGLANADTLETIAAIEQATGWTAEELANGLAMLDRVYSNDCRTASGRVKWHGRVIATMIDEYEKTKSNYHEDGYVYTTKFGPVTNRSLDKKLSAEERAKKREDEARRKAELAEQKRLDRIALLTTNLTAEVRALMSSKNWPEELATLYLKNELNTLTTNIVNAVIMPQ